jgi:hypothetical protein
MSSNLFPTESAQSGARTWTQASYWDEFQSEADSNFDPDLWLYRERTVALLKRYLRISLEVGRLPSLLGRELFRSKVTAYGMSSFEDGVIFVHDVEHILDKLNDFFRQLITAIIFQECTHDETAELLHCNRRMVSREFAAALDQVSELFLAGGLLNPLQDPNCGKLCQEAGMADFPISDCK